MISFDIIIFFTKIGSYTATFIIGTTDEGSCIHVAAETFGFTCIFLLIGEENCNVKKMMIVLPY